MIEEINVRVVELENINVTIAEIEGVHVTITSAFPGFMKGENEGDILRWDAGSESWKPVASPYKEMTYDEFYKVYLVEE